MINFNGKIVESINVISNENRAFLYGDSVFETLKVVNAKVLFIEDHYFRLMASMRILRMKIPPFFTLEYMEEQIIQLVTINNIRECARVRLLVFRNEGGFYSPSTNQVSFTISSYAIENKEYQLNTNKFEVELFKDFLVSKQLLSNLKTTNRVINVVASIFAKENDYNTCLLLNNEKSIAEAISGNIFMKIDNLLITPPLTDGCINGIMRKQILKIAKTMDNILVEEKSISPFELQNADELFITNVITGIQPISKYRKKIYVNNFAVELIDKLNSIN